MIISRYLLREILGPLAVALCVLCLLFTSYGAAAFLIFSVMSKLNLILAGALCAFTAAQLSAVDIPAQYDTGGFAVGCQAYTFKDFTVFEAIDKTVEVGGGVRQVISEARGARLSRRLVGTAEQPVQRAALLLF